MTDQFRSLRVAAAQPMTVPGDLSGNIDRMEPLIAEAAASGAAAVAFSEGAVTGYDLQGIAVEAAIARDDGALMRVADHAAK